MQETRSVTTSSGTPVRQSSGTSEPAQKPKLLDRLPEALRSRHYGRRREQTYCLWVKRFIYFHNVRHPAQMDEQGINAFLIHVDCHAFRRFPDLEHLAAHLSGVRWGAAPGEGSGVIP